LNPKQVIYLIIDIVLIIIALVFASLLRFGMDIPSHHFPILSYLIPLAVVTKIAVFYLFGFYSQLWRYASLKEGFRLFKGISVASLVILGMLFFFQRFATPRGVLAIDWLLTLLFIGSSRFIARARDDIFSSSAANYENQKKVIVVGAGEAGSTLVKHMQRHPDKGYKPVAFLDDNKSKIGHMIHGVKVLGNTRSLPSIIADYTIDEIVLAMPSAESQERKRVALECKELGIPCKTVPDISELVDGEESLMQIREINIKELLGRKEVEIDLKEVIDYYKGKVILITGAAGSIGSELCRQVTSLEPAKVIAADISENGLYHLEEEMRSWLEDSQDIFETRIMDVRDKRAVARVFEEYRPHTIFHAAAYKHVPIMEDHPIEAMENNFLGTRVMIEAAGKHGVERFVFVSTDKAVKPTSMMGLSKQLCELSIKVASNDTGNTKFMAVRFGNVLGSNGSVIPKFKRQIANREPVTVTHPDITRYFMTIHEAVHLVIQAMPMGNGGEIFVLNMGEPVLIVDLAKSMIRLYGLEPDKDIPIAFTGLRPGEKLFEELFSEDETVNKTDHPKIFEVLSDNSLASAEFLNELETVIRRGDKRELVNFLSQKYVVHA